MASTGEEEVEYESDPKKVKCSLAMQRRKVTSDDEEGKREANNNIEVRMDRRAVIHSDESDGQGSAIDYYDDEEELDLEEEIYDEEEEDEEKIDEKKIEEVGRGELQGNMDRTGDDMKEAVVGDGNRNMDEVVEINNNNNVKEEDEEEKKENEPFAVPTVGAFYMHDDRFQDNVGGRHRI
ncbi:hypothetical protein CRYUN_Cryun34aG0082400 [Craigia yunnanensis]